MRDIVKLGEELRTRVLQEMEVLVAERTVMRDILESRGRELAIKRDEELRRIDQWADQQRGMVKEVFAAMTAENQSDLQKNDAAIKRMSGETTVAAKPPSKAAAAFARAAE